MPPTVAAIGTPAEVLQHVQALVATHGLTVLDPESASRQLRPGDLAIFYSEHFERFRRCCTELKERQVATLYLVDGILEWRNAWENRPDEPACPWTMRPVLSHKVACIGDSQARTLAAWGNGAKIEITGLPRLDGWSEIQTAPRVDTFRVLVATAKFPGFTPEQVDITCRSLRDLQQLERERVRIAGRSLQIEWRVADSLASGLGLECRSGHGITDVLGASPEAARRGGQVPIRSEDCAKRYQTPAASGPALRAQLACVDAVLTTPSTLMLEAMLARRPVGLLDYHNAPHYVPAAWRITAPEQLLPVLRQLAEPDAARLKLQDELLCDALQTGESATARVGQLIDRMLAVAAECLAAGQPLAFAAGLLEPPVPSAEAFSHQRLYPAHAAFAEASKVELQAELGHCRREIRHLEQVIAGLRSELGQAHEIFEQIQRHPVAGPVVRLRQRFLDFMARIRAKSQSGKRQERGSGTDSLRRLRETAPDPGVFRIGPRTAPSSADPVAPVSVDPPHEGEPCSPR